jgi:hypothetical protein
MNVNRLTYFVAAILLIAGGCSKKSNPLSPAAPGIEFPPDTKFSLTLYSPSSTSAVSQMFEVRVVLYNVTNVAGMALEVSYPPGNVEILGVTGGTTFFPTDSVISISHLEPDSGRVSYGVAYKNTVSGASKSGSGLVCTFKCKAKAPGTASFVINQNTLDINTPSGTLINNFAALLLENLTFNIH